LNEEIEDKALQVHAALEASGLDHGPISVHGKMHAMGLPQIRSTASLARIFREAASLVASRRRSPASGSATSSPRR
jgi:hypothetical protein